jgi:hypothetical protein
LRVASESMNRISLRRGGIEGRSVSSFIATIVQHRATAAGAMCEAWPCCLPC